MRFSRLPAKYSAPSLQSLARLTLHSAPIVTDQRRGHLDRREPRSERLASFLGRFQPYQDRRHRARSRNPLGVSLDLHFRCCKRLLRLCRLR